MPAWSADQFELVVQGSAGRKYLLILFVVTFGEFGHEVVAGPGADYLPFGGFAGATNKRGVDLEIAPFDVLGTKHDVDEGLEQGHEFVLAPKQFVGRPIGRGTAHRVEIVQDVEDCVRQTAMVKPERARDELLVDESVELVGQWLTKAEQLATAEQLASMAQLEGVVTDPEGVRFVMAFVDRVVRPDRNRVAARQLVDLVAEHRLPGFLSRLDRVLLSIGARLAPLLPWLVMPLARRRMRGIVGHLVTPAEPDQLASQLQSQRDRGYAVNVNLLGEAVLGEREAQRRFEELLDLIEQPNVDVVSVKLSAVASQLNRWAHEDCLSRVAGRLRQLVEKGASMEPPVFVNFDMEEYHDLDLTLDAFMAVLDEPQLVHADAGIVLQAYLPDALPALQRLVEWANDRHRRGGAEIKVRLVKGANLAMEHVDAALHGWVQAPYDTKAEVDANYKRCVDWLCTPSRMEGVRLGLASHNLFDVAWAKLLSEQRGVSQRVQFEMLQGMAAAQAAAVASDITPGAAPEMLLYTPAVRAADFDVAISYLFRRLEENAADQNFMRHLFDLAPGSADFDHQAELFRDAVAGRGGGLLGSRRTQDRLSHEPPPYGIGESFRNEPSTDPTLPSGRRFIDAVQRFGLVAVRAPVVTDPNSVDEMVARSRACRWSQTSLFERQRVLHRAAELLGSRRVELLATMQQEARKTLAEADGEVDEAIDFARWYGDQAAELDHASYRLATFSPLGVMVVVPPWNFPVAIPAGGVFASLAAGNSVVLKPAPETPRCAEIVAEVSRAALREFGHDPDAVIFVRTPDDETGRHLVTSADGVVLTGSVETARLFQDWKPDIKLFAETSGKNAMVITPNADIDQAVADLVASAFGHSGQKCSAASLAILVDGVGRTARFRRQLTDAVESLSVGPTAELATTMGPTIGPPNNRLRRALTNLEEGEDWLVVPVGLDDDADLWSPGVRDNVSVNSWFHQTECFGPVLGLIHVATLDEAIRVQNAGEFGLTGGIHTLDPFEVEAWLDQVEVGNAYVNRTTTGAMVQRQPFGGWKRSSVGPGAKAGGPNYVAQLGRWSCNHERPSEQDDYEMAWSATFSHDHDPSDLFCEANIFRYRPRPLVAARFGSGASPQSVERVPRAARLCGTALLESDAATETQDQFAARLLEHDVEVIRLVGEAAGPVLVQAANTRGIHIADSEVTGAGRVELLHYLREQSLSVTTHRFGNLTNSLGEIVSHSVRG